jgi:hypothetical protein
VRFLVALGADPKAGEEYDENPLYLAASRGLHP